MHRFIVTSRRLAATQNRILGSPSTAFAISGGSGNGRVFSGSFRWESQRASSSTAARPPAATSSKDDDDDNVAPWDAVEGLHSEGEWAGCRRDFMAPITIGARGGDILQDPLFNKGTAFKSEERDRLRIRGLLPAKVNNIHKQIDRFLMHLRRTESAIEKHIKLEDLHDRNETLYHRVLVDHIEGREVMLRTANSHSRITVFQTYSY